MAGGREWEEGETHPSLGVHPSLESVCAVITVSNRWDDAWEESVCVFAYEDYCLSLRGILWTPFLHNQHPHQTTPSSTVICHP